MLKESILLVASTGLVIYLITPSEEPPKAEPVAAEVQEMIQPVAQISDDSWEADESEEADDENFVFGEPMTIAGNESDEQLWDEDNNPNLQHQPSSKGSNSRPFSGGRNQPLAGSPPPGAPGSIENPIER